MGRAHTCASGSAIMLSIRGLFLASVSCVLLMAAPARAQDAGYLPTPDQQKADAIDQAKQPDANLSPADQLKLLQLQRRDMQERMGDFDARIQALESKLGVPHSAPAPAVATPVIVTPPLRTLTPEEQQAASEPAKNAVDAFMKREELAGTFKRDTGWVLIDEPIARRISRPHGLCPLPQLERRSTQPTPTVSVASSR